MTTIPHKFDLVIHHGNCYDGFTAAWVAHRHSPDAEFVGAQWGDPPPDVTGKHVLIADFSYPREVLLEMESKAKSLLVLDHHVKPTGEYADLECVIFDVERSGAGLTWDVLWGSPRPRIVNQVEDRDLGKFSLEGSRRYHAAMTSFPMTFENWDTIANMPWAEMHVMGIKIGDFSVLTGQKLASRAKVMTLWNEDSDNVLAGLQVWVVNTPVEFVSETAEALFEREPHLPVLGWMWDGERGDYYCSIRSREDGPDVSVIAKSQGGGGHKHAAGFRMAKAPPEMLR